MKKFKVVVSDGQITIRAKLFEAKNVEEAIKFAEEEDWTSDGWEDLDTLADCHVLEDLCVEEK